MLFTLDWILVDLIWSQNGDRIDKIVPQFFLFHVLLFLPETNHNTNQATSDNEEQVSHT